MFNLRLGGITLTILQWYLILTVYLQYVNYCNGETEVDKNLEISIHNSSRHIGIHSRNKVQNVSILTIPKVPNNTNASIYSNSQTRFCKDNNVFRTVLEEALVESQGRNNVSLDSLNKSICDMARRVKETLFRPHFPGRCDYDKFVKILIDVLYDIEDAVSSGFTKINDVIEQLLHFVRSQLFLNPHNQNHGICYNQYSQGTLRNLVKQLSTTIVSTFRNIMETLSTLSYLAKNGPQNTRLSSDECNYESARHYLIESELKLETDSATAFYNTMRVAFVMTRIIGSHLNDQEQKDIKLIENVFAAVNGALENGEIRADLSETNQSNNPPLPNSSEIFTNPYGCTGTYTDKTNLRLSPNAQAGIKDVVILVLSELLGDFLEQGIEYLASVIFSTSTTSILPDTLNGTGLMMEAINKDSSDPNCTRYYNELQDEIHLVVNESVEFGRESVTGILKYLQNITDFLINQNAGFHFLPPSLRITEWLSFIDMVYNDVIEIIKDYPPVVYTYIDKMEKSGQNIMSTFIKILNANCLARLLPILENNTAILNNITQTKHVRNTRDIGPLILKLTQALPIDLAPYDVGQDVKQRNATTLTTWPPLLPVHAEGSSSSSSVSDPNINDTIAEWINLLKLISDKIMSKVRLVYNLTI